MAKRKLQKKSLRGRKPLGPVSKSSVFSLRLEPSLRAALENAAGDRSLSEEIHHRLQASISTPRQRDPYLKVLFALIGEMAERDPLPGQLGTHAAKFEAFRAAVDTFLMRICPAAGEPERPADLSEGYQRVWDSMGPGGIGVVNAEVLWHQLITMELPPDGIGRYLPSGSLDFLLPRAREKLGVAFDPEMAAMVAQLREKKS